jgi:uncharacterized SAM-binding protein YcdF (DUF218 family)
MKLAISGEGALIGGAAGALIGFFLDAFRFNEPTGRFSHLSPSQIVLIGLVLGAILGAFGRYRILLGVNAFLAAVYFIVAYTPVMEPITRTWVRSDPIPPSADAIVVLSAAVTPDTALNAEGTERLLAGLELFQRGVAPRIFTSHVNTKYPDGPRSSTPDQERLIRMAGASAGWVMLDSVHSTRDEAVKTAAKLPRGRRVVLVTTAMHTRRACAAFEAVGLGVSCYPARARLHSTWHPAGTGDRLAAFGDYIYEALGSLEYRWRGWLR